MEQGRKISKEEALKKEARVETLSDNRELFENSSQSSSTDFFSRKNPSGMSSGEGMSGLERIASTEISPIARYFRCVLLHAPRLEPFSSTRVPGIGSDGTACRIHAC